MFDLLDLIRKLLSQIIIGVCIIRWFGLMDELRYYHNIPLMKEHLLLKDMFACKQKYPHEDLATGHGLNAKSKYPYTKSSTTHICVDIVAHYK